MSQLKRIKDELKEGICEDWKERKVDR